MLLIMDYLSIYEYITKKELFTVYNNKYYTGTL